MVQRVETGERDELEFVSHLAEVLREALWLQARRCLRFQLDELQLLGGELSLDGRLVQVSAELRQLAAQAPVSSQPRQDEPYRLATNGSRPLARGRLRLLRRAVDVFGFHLAAIDLRQNADVHERVVGELFEVAGPGTGYLAHDEAARIALLAAEIAAPRPLMSPFLAYSAETSAELAILRETAEAHRRYGRSAVANYVISKADGVSDVLEVALLLKEAGLLRPQDATLDLNIVPLFETIADLRSCGEVIAAKYSNPEVGRWNLETLAAATLEATLLQQRQPPSRPDFLAAMETLSGHAYAAYRDLVYDTPGSNCCSR